MLESDLPSDIQREAAGTSVPTPVYEATRSLLRITLASEAVAVLSRAVRELGGDVVLGAAVDEDRGLVEAWLSQGQQFRAGAPEGTAALRQIRRYLPPLVEDARRVLTLTSGTERLARQAGIDAVTGLPDRHSMSRIFSRLSDGDLIIAIDLDNPGQTTAPDGAGFSDELVRAFSLALRQSVRESDYCGRMHGEGFLIVLRRAGSPAAERLLDRLRAIWGKARPAPVSFSAGIAPIAAEGWRPAVLAAGKALDRARQSDTEHWETATEADYGTHTLEPEGAGVPEPSETLPESRRPAGPTGSLPRRPLIGRPRADGRSAGHPQPAPKLR